MNRSEGDTRSCRWVYRNPFRIHRLSWLAKLHIAGFRPRRRLAKRFVGRPAKALFKAVLGATNCSGPSSFEITVGGAARLVPFSPRNLQFGALYMPQHAPLYEPETAALLDVLVRPGDTFYDIGANWGFYALFVASRPGFTGRVEAFEPFPPTFADLRRTVDAAGLADIIGVHQIALSDAVGTASMAPWDGLQSGLARLGAAADAGTARVDVPLARLDGLGLPKPDVIKIDAEDHEAEVLQGAEGILDQARPMLVLENWLHPTDPGLTLGPLRLLEGKAYRLFAIGWRTDGVDGPVQPKTAVAPGAALDIAVVPMRADQRFLLAQQLNILAVPAEKLGQLDDRFAGFGGALS